MNIDELDMQNEGGAKMSREVKVQKGLIIYTSLLLIWAVSYAMVVLRMDIKTIIKDYAIKWGLLAMINAGIAHGKNKSGITWGTLSLLIGPIATLLIVAFNKKEIEDKNETAP